jgi:aspartate ammonia-lyase
MSGRKTELRTETDGFGEITLPANAYWGAQTARSCRNGIKLSHFNPKFLEALLILHKAAALASAEQGRLDPAIGRSIGQAVDEVLGGQWLAEFIVAPLQLASFFDITANVREVLANRAGEMLGARVGSYAIVQPVQVGQDLCPGDIFPTALRISLLYLQKDLNFVLRDLERLLRRKALEFERAVRSEPGSAGLGQMFNGFGFEVGKICKRISEASNNLLELNLAGFSVNGSTGEHAQSVLNKLITYSGFNLRLADDYARVNQSANDFLEMSAALRLTAVTLNRIADQLYAVAAGSQPGKLEIQLPAVHYGDGRNGITPRPVIIDFAGMVAFQIIGMDTANHLAGQSAPCEIQGKLPLIAHNLLQSMELLQQTVAIFNNRCIGGIAASTILTGGEPVIEPLGTT